jgi:hypothetical protein
MSESSRAFYDAHPALEADLRALYPAGEFGTVKITNEDVREPTPSLSC